MYTETVCFATVDRYILPKKYRFTRLMESTAAIRNTKVFDGSHKNVMIPTYNFAKL